MRLDPPQSANGLSFSSSASDEVHTAFMEERVIHERQIFHLQQQLAQTLHLLDHVRGSFGVPPSVAMPQFGSAPPMLPFMTDRVHLNNNGTAVTHDDGQSQPSNSGTMNAT